MSKNLTLGIMRDEVIQRDNMHLIVSNSSSFELKNDYGGTVSKKQILMELYNEEVQEVRDKQGDIVGYNWTPDLSKPRYVETVMDEHVEGTWQGADVYDNYIYDMIVRSGEAQANNKFERENAVLRRGKVVAALKGEPVDVPYIIYSEDSVTVHGDAKYIGIPAYWNGTTDCMTKLDLNETMTGYGSPACVVQIKNNNPYDYEIKESEIKDGGDSSKILHVLSLPDGVAAKQSGKSVGMADTQFFVHTPGGLFQTRMSDSQCRFDTLAKYTATGAYIRKNSDPIVHDDDARPWFTETDIERLRTLAAIWTPPFDTDNLFDGHRVISPDTAIMRRDAAVLEDNIKWVSVDIDASLVSSNSGEGSYFVVPAENGAFHIKTDGELNDKWNGRFDIYFNCAVYEDKDFADNCFDMFYDTVKRADGGRSVRIRAFGEGYFPDGMIEDIEKFNALDGDTKGDISAVLSRVDYYTVEDLKTRGVKECVITPDGHIFGEGQNYLDAMAEYYLSDSHGDMSDGMGGLGE